MNSNNNSSSNASSVFIEHVKQALSTIPPVTKLILFLPFIIFTIDSLLFPLLNVHTSISNWLYLDFDNSVLGFQLFRLILYPFATDSLVQLIITPLWLIPETYKLERQTGSLKFLWILILIFTILPGIAYILTTKLWVFSMLERPSWDLTFKGMTGWVVGLITWSYLHEENNDQQDRMIAGDIRIARKFWPLIVFVFFIFLAPANSILLNIMAAIAGLLYVKEKLQFLIPSDEKFVEYEAKSWLRLLTASSNFVSMDAAGNSYLPIFNPTSSHNEAPAPPSAPSPGNFPGQGIRLGSS